MARFCRYCGAALEYADARFCSSCGAELPVVETGRSPATTTPGTPPGSAYLVVRAWGQPHRQAPLDRPVVRVGRAADNELVIAVNFVSKHHGVFEQRGTEWVYRDLGSLNGTYINGRRAQQAVLRHGDILRVGDPEGNSASLTFWAGVSADMALPVGVLSLGERVLGSARSLIIGRDPQAQIPLRASVVSWRHARIDQLADGHLLTDLNSTNGTFVNGRRIMQPYRLRQGDVIRVGPFTLVYAATEIQQYAAHGGMRLDGFAITRTVGRGKRHKQILTQVSLSVYPREFVALVGTSGAGKSTLLNALSGVERAQDGRVLVNGDDLYRHFDLYRTMIGYVPQDDIVHKDLTVEQVLQYAARLRLPPDTRSAEIERRITQVLQEVGMTPQRTQVVRSLSGGQRKRVSIAMELLAEPRLFFMDEPTSGLDPGLEKKMMYTLRHLADAGRTVVLVTHATANITQCDHVCFLAQGRLVYYGPPEEALSFFGVTSEDFADIYEKLDAPDSEAEQEKALEWAQRYAQSSQQRRFVSLRQQKVTDVKKAAAESPEQRGPRVNPFKQFWILSQRYLALVLRDRLLLTVLAVIMPLIGVLILGMADAQALIGHSEAEIAELLAADLAAGETTARYVIVDKGQRLCNMMALAAVMLGLFSAAYEIVKERSIFRRERMVTLRLMPYVVSKITILCLFAAVQCLFFLFVIAVKVKMPAAGVWLPAPVELYTTVLLATLASTSLGIFISALTPRQNTVVYIVLLLLFFQLIFAGVMFQLPGAAGKLSPLTLTRWTNEALGASVNLDALNALTRSRSEPEPITHEVVMEVERPVAGWEPVTIVSRTEILEIPCLLGPKVTVPITVPVISENALVTTTEQVTRTVTIDPGAVETFAERDLLVDYSSTQSHLLKSWGMLGGWSLLYILGTVFVLKTRDVR